MNILLVGIASGLAAAVCQSITYLLTRHYAQRRAPQRGLLGPGTQLVVLGHVWMALITLALVPLVWPAAGVPWAALWLPLLGNTAGYCTGQVAQVMALRYAEASRVSPLFTAKLIVSSMFVLAFGLQTGGSGAVGITALQWIAIPICVFAGVSISFTGGRIKRQALVAVACAAVGFSISDYCITLMLKQTLLIPGIGKFHASLVAGLLSYVAVGIVSVSLLPVVGSRKRADWLEALPFSVVWFGSMVTLYNAFALVGILLGTILQCTRGFITIIFGAVVMRLGHHHIEPKVPRRIILQRLAAGMLMFFGICLYVGRDAKTLGQLRDQLQGVPAATAPEHR